MSSETNILSYFSELEAPRTGDNITHPLVNIISITILGVICGAEGWVDIERYGYAKQHWLSEFLDLSKGSDPITLQDIRSARTYRVALNRELIRRRSGKYSQAWLGRRVGVTPCTIQRYIDLERIQSYQILHETPLDWNNLEYIPTSSQAKRAGFSIQPYFLQDENGKRYPPKSRIAKKLLRQKQRVSLFRRDYNVYWCSDDLELSVTEQTDRKQPKTPSHFLLPQYEATEIMTMDMPIDVPDVLDTGNEFEASMKPKYVQPDHRSTRFYKKPLANSDDEWLAQQVYRSACNLQEVEARQLVYVYGKQAVGQTLGRMTYLQELRKIQNPAGFMKVACRVAWKSIRNKIVSAPEYQSPKERKGRNTYKDLWQDPLFQSESYLQWRSELIFT